MKSTYASTRRAGGLGDEERRVEMISGLELQTVSEGPAPSRDAARRSINWQARTVPPITNIIEAANEPTPGMISRLEKRPKTAIVKASTATFAFISGSCG